MFRKFKKLIGKPHIFVRDALLNRYPLHLTQGESSFGRESEIIKVCDNIDFPFTPEFDIDIVYTWVSSEDSVWNDKRNSYVEMWDGKTSPSAMEASRFDNHNEIYFSLVSIERFMPWVRNIYIVTDGQVPPIPREIKERICIVDHSEIIPKEYLPTFNSHVIEACLHKIEGLSEHFIYFNDDFFVSRDIRPSHFFQSNDIASIFIGNKDINPDSNMETATSIACKNSNLLFIDKFGRGFDRNLVHTYVPLRKSYYLLAYELFGGDIFSFLSNKFRSRTDINMATFFVPYLQYICGVSTPKIDISYYFNIRSPAASFFYDRLLDAKITNSLPHSFCANDFSSCEFPHGNSLDAFNRFARKFYECY